MENASIRLGIDFSEVEGDLNKMKRVLKTTSSELRNHAEEYKVLEDSTEKYSSRLDILSDQQKLQKGIVDVQRGAYEKLLKEKGKLDKETMRAYENYKKEETALFRVGNEIKKTTDSLEKYEKEQVEAAKKAEELEKQTDDLADSTEDLTEELGKGEKALKDTGDAAEVAEGKYKKFTQKVKEGGDTIMKAGGQIADTGKKMTGAFSIPVLVGGGGAVKAAVDYENTVLQLKNSLGLTDKEAEKLAETSTNIFTRGFGESGEEVNQTLLQVKQNMSELDGKELEEATISALTLSKTFDADVNEVTRAADRLMKEYGMTAEEAFDLIAAGAQNGLNFSDELFDNVAEYSGYFSDMGFSAEEYFQVLKNGTKDGAYNLDYIHDVMKEFDILIKEDKGEMFGNLSQETQNLWGEFKKGEATTKDVFEAVTTELGGMEDKVKANEIGVALFGTKWEDMGADAVLSLNNTGDEFDNVNGKMGEMSKNAEDSFGQRFIATWRELKESLLPLGDELLKIAETYMPKVQEVVEKVTNAIQNMSPETMDLIIKIGAIVAVLGPAITVFGWLATGIGAIVKVGGLLMPVLGFLLKGLKFLTGPVGILISILTIMAGMFFKSKSELEGFAGVIDGMKIVFGDIVDWFKRLPETIAQFVLTVGIKFTQFKEKVVETIAELVLKLVLKFHELKEKVKTTIVEFVANLVVGFLELKQKIVTTITEFVLNLVLKFQELKETVKTTIVELVANLVVNFLELKQKIITTVTEFVTGVINKAKELRNTVVTTITEFVVNLVNKIAELRNKIINTVVDLVTKFVNRVVELRNKIINTVIDLVTKFVNKVMELRRKIIDTFVNLVTTTVSKMVELRNKIVGKVQEMVTTFVNKVIGMKDQAIRGFNILKARAEEIVGRMKDKIVEIFDKIVSFAKGLPKKIGDGIKSMASKALDGVKSLGNKLAGKLGEVINGVIRGINDLTVKVGIDAKLEEFDIPTFSTGTGGHKGGLMTVGDKGPGNGKGVREIVQFPNGRSMLFNKETTLNAPKGTQVMSNKVTEKLLSIPRYSKGTNGGGPVADFLSKGGDIVRGIKDGALGVWDAVTNPSELLGGLLKKFMDRFLDLQGFPRDFAKGMIDGFKGSALGFLNNVKDEAQPTVKGNSLFPGYGLNYGFGKYPFKFNNGRHFGEDYSHNNSPVRIPMDGRVTRNFWDTGGGRSLEVQSGKIYQLFMHLNKSLVDVGEQVRAGQVVAVSGNTGANTTGAHLHYQTYRDPSNMNGSAFNPKKLLNNGAGMFDYFTGGIVSDRGVYQLSEKGSEAVVPLTDDSSFSKMLAYLNTYYNNKGNKNKRTNQLPDLRNKGGSNEQSDLMKMMVLMYQESKSQTQLMMEENQILRQQLEKEIGVNLDGREVARGVKPYLKKELAVEDSRNRRLR